MAFYVHSWLRPMSTKYVGLTSYSGILHSVFCKCWALASTWSHTQFTLLTACTLDSADILWPQLTRSLLKVLTKASYSSHSCLPKLNNLQPSAQCGQPADECFLAIIRIHVESQSKSGLNNDYTNSGGKINRLKSQWEENQKCSGSQEHINKQEWRSITGPWEEQCLALRYRSERGAREERK